LTIYAISAIIDLRNEQSIRKEISWFIRDKELWSLTRWKPEVWEINKEAAGKAGQE
jgi:hypothetical protein